MTGSSFDINSVVQDALQLVTRPVEFYRRMPHAGGYVEPIIFLVVMAFVAGVILTIFSLFGTAVVGSMAMGVWVIVMFPIMALIGSFVGAGIMFVIWKLMGSDKSFETSYRCVAYASAIYPITAVLGLMPYIGTIVGIAWGMYLMVAASTEVHAITVKKAMIVFGVIGVLAILFNVSAEMAARSTRDQLQQQFEQMGLNSETMKHKSPEELGKMVGEFMKGMQEAEQQ